MGPRLGVVVFAALLLSACGGGGGTPGPRSSACPKQIPASLLGEIDASGGDSSGGGGGGGASGDGAGSLGQFRNAEVIVRDRDFIEIGRTRTDADGKVKIKFADGCDGPLEVEYKGGSEASYFDEASGRLEPFPEGQSLRARFPSLPAQFGVTPYTEAAVRLMDSGPGGMPKTLDPDAINSANQRISEVLTDQMAGTFREKQDAFGLIDITKQPVLVNESNFATPGTLTDTTAGRYGAVIAGFVRGSNTFAGGNGSGGGASPVAAPSPALRATAQLIEDLADGQLDLQGPGGPVLAGAEAPAYTYETLWRAKTIAAGLASQQAGDAALRQSTEKTLVAEYVFSILKTYKTEFFLPSDSDEGYNLRSTGGQTVRLYADGLLTVDRSVSAAFGVSGSTYVARPTPPRPGRKTATEQDVVMTDPATGQNAKFVDVKIGTRGQLLALQQDRKAFVYVQPIEPYIVRGDELTGQPFEYYRALLAPSLQVVQQRVSLGSNENLRVVSFTSSPAREDRTFPSGPAPDFIYVLSDGSLWAASLADPSRPFALPQPEPLQSVVYDQFVTPGFDPAYGRPPAEPLQLPWTGPRRLYGLTRGGEVRTWLEGETAAGVRLAVPGKVVLLAAESKTGVFALTGDGKAFWVNADQALVAEIGSTIPRQPRLQDHARRFPLHHVEQVTGLNEPICWLAHTEAIACKSGAVYRWSEALALMEWDDPAGSRQNTYVPVGSAIKATREEGLPPFWRISAVDEFYRASSLGQTINIAGVRFLKADGTSNTLEEERGLRNLVTTLHDFPATDFEPAGTHQYLKGAQLRTAFESLFNAQRPLAIERLSTTPPDQYRLLHSITPLAPNRFQYRLLVDNSSDPRQPNADFTIDFGSSGSGIDSFSVSAMHLGDTRAGGTPGGQSVDAVPNGQPVVFKDDDFIRAEITARAWQLYYRNPVSNTSNIARIKLIPNLIMGRPYDFRLCFAFEGQAPEGTLFRFGRMGCTLHDNAGRFLGTTSGLASYHSYPNGAPVGSPTNIDFGQIYEAD